MAVAVPEAEAGLAATTVVEFDPSGLIVPMLGGDFSLGLNDVMVNQLPEVNDIIGVTMTGTYSVDYFGSGGELFNLFIGISGGNLGSPVGSVPAGTTIPVTWDYSVTAVAGTVTNESVFFGARLFPSGGGTETALYMGDSFNSSMGNRDEAGSLEFENEAAFPEGSYDMYLQLQWRPTDAEEQLIVEFGDNSLDINPIPEPASAMFFWVAAMVGLMAQRRRWWRR
jgi:hypothetical protein